MSKEAKEPVRTRGSAAEAAGAAGKEEIPVAPDVAAGKNEAPVAPDATAGKEEVAETSPQPPAPPAKPPQATPPPPTTDRLVVTNITLERGDCSVAGKNYRLVKGQQTRVPEEVRNVLRDAGYLLSDTPAR